MHRLLTLPLGVTQRLVRDLRPRQAPGASARRLSARSGPERPSLAMAAPLRMIDIGANLLDPMYSGQYNDKQYHPPDLEAVLERAWKAGVAKIIITAGSLKEAKAALELTARDDRLYCTVGVHPTRCGEFDSHPGGPEQYMQELQAVLQEGKARGKVVAVGECGLDYDRLHFCDKETQLKYFERQFQLAKSSSLPMFLHLRAAAADFMHLMRRHEAELLGGVVHSFDGTAEELQGVLELDKLSVGINGCSLKTALNLDVMAAVPLDRLMIETDCPWCEVRSTHAGKHHVKTVFEAKDRKKHDPAYLVKGRSEPCSLVQVLEVVAGHRGEKDLAVLAEQVWGNTSRMFFPEPHS